ncbi:hypothetical protein GGP63_002696 [Salinibacter ruber]|uniref:Uncharacterized protein n=1 Tax=Salinibacter ruber TaxID=146919 RepID=A0A9X2ZZE9_9BACT|nr:hypothetical protein [Salinibacter ruber]MCS3615939.1 hypothetical protein [Salinibacter ruber]MCS3648095.1 hypothetical protein [Salinibacter ruber]MCS3857439.1 hypothetical protein [Salinibacter ruber]MCS3864265.1 hypothetical protein [Salinibacter ruber]
MRVIGVWVFTSLGVDGGSDSVPPLPTSPQEEHPDEMHLRNRRAVPAKEGIENTARGLPRSRRVHPLFEEGRAT